jgi:hypothetical protein
MIGPEHSTGKIPHVYQVFTQLFEMKKDYFKSRKFRPWVILEMLTFIACFKSVGPTIKA